MAGMSPLLAGQAARVLAALPLALAVTLLAARAVLALELRWFYPALWLVMMVAWTCQVMGSWGLAGAVSDTRQAKRLFPLYGAGLITGGVLGGLATGPIAAVIHAENLLFVWTGALVVAHALARGLVGRAQARRRRRRGRGLGRQLAEGLRDVWDWPLLRWMSVSLILFAVLYFTVTLLFAEAATARYPRADQLAGFLGLFLGVANGAALLVSLLLANRLFARFGLPTMVMGLAAIYVAGFVVLTVTTSFGALLAFRDDADAHGAVVAGVSDPDPAVRRVSASILSDLAWPDAEPALLPALSDDDPHVRTAAGRGLGRGGADPGRVRPLLEDPDPAVRAAAAEAVAGDPEGRPAADAALGVMERHPRPEWRGAPPAAPGGGGAGGGPGAPRDPGR